MFGHDLSAGSEDKATGFRNIQDLKPCMVRVLINIYVGLKFVED